MPTMSLREAELTRSERAHRSHKKQIRRRKRRKQRRQNSALPAVVNDSQILTFRQWVAMASLSVRCGRNILKSGKGPPVVQLTSRRIGIRFGDAKRWLEERLRT
jgi:hypothetical protein